MAEKRGFPEFLSASHLPSSVVAHDYYEGSEMRLKRTLATTAIAVTGLLALGGSGAMAAGHGDAMKNGKHHHHHHGHAMEHGGSMHK